VENALLEVKDLKVVYQTDQETVHAVNNISFSLERGKTLGLVGETGAGKTTTALTLMQLLPERTGKILGGNIVFHGKNLIGASHKDLRAMRGEKMAMIFQDPMTSLDPIMSIGDQIWESIMLHNTDHRSKKQIDQRVDDVLTMVGIQASRKFDYPHQFSGGMKQRVVIAIALACEPDLLIADEPTTALDVTIQAQVLMMIRELRDKLGTSMIMITHDLGIVAQTCDDVAVMYAGELIEIGSAEDIFTGNAHHPYTTGLFGSIPSVRGNEKRLHPIPGLMPNPSDLPEGCNFSLRCPHCMDICHRLKPGIYGAATHKIKCYLHEGNPVGPPKEGESA